jgi:hypothetical protein
MTRSKVSLERRRILYSPPTQTLFYLRYLFDAQEISTVEERRLPSSIPHAQNQFSRRTSSSALPVGSSTGVIATPSRCPFFAIQRHNRMFQLLPSRKHYPNQAFQPFLARWLFHIVPPNGAMTTFQFALQLTSKSTNRITKYSGKNRSESQFYLGMLEGMTQTYTGFNRMKRVEWIRDRRQRLSNWGGVEDHLPL